MNIQDVSIRRSFLKEPQLAWKKKGVVYKVPHAECDCVCIRETRRMLESSLSEHRGAVKRNDTKNGIAVYTCMHGRHMQHKVDWAAAAATVKHPGGDKLLYVRTEEDTALFVYLLTVNTTPNSLYSHH